MNYVKRGWGAVILLCILLFLSVILYSTFPRRGSDTSHFKELFAIESVEGLDFQSEKLCKIPKVDTMEQFEAYFNKRDYICKIFTYFGKGDGSKGVCLDPILNMDPSHCHVLSFGIHDEWSFDDSFDQFGCKVYSFDPTMGKGDFRRSKNILFYELGIGSISGKTVLGNQWMSSEVERYENILKKLKLTNEKINYLKMDVEMSELDFFYDVFRYSPHLLKNIQQIGMEVHYGIPGALYIPQLFWIYFHKLECHGFKLMDARMYGGRAEVVWVKP